MNTGWKPKICVKISVIFCLFLVGIYTTVHFDNRIPFQMPHVINCTAQRLRLSDEEVSTKTLFKVPNVIHLIWYADMATEFRFDKALSVLSAIKYIKPEAVHFHTNIEPKGKYYDMLKNISIFKVIHREPPKDALPRVYYDTDYSDYDKVKIILEEGGIYLDLDVMVTRSFDDLRKYPCTLGLEGGSKVCSGVIVCTKGHPFLYLWLNAFHTDFKNIWAYNSGIVPSRLIKRFPNLTHVERTTLHRPSWSEVDKIWGTKLYPWRQNYAVHTWIRVALREKILLHYPTPDSIKTMRTTYGQMARDVYYGNSEVIVR